MNFVSESAEEYEDIIEKSRILQSNINEKKEFIKDYNDSIEELKEQHGIIALLTNQIEQVPLRGKWLFPFAQLFVLNHG